MAKLRIGIVVDSCCDLPREFIDEHGIVVLPIALRVGGRIVEDKREPLATQEFYRKYLDKRDEDFAESIPYTVEQIERLFLEKLALEFDFVYCLTITAKRSPIFDNATRASRTILAKYKDVRRAAGLPERFGLAVASSRNMFTGQAVQVAELARLVAAGKTPSEIGDRLQKLVAGTHTYLVPTDLFHIFKRAQKKGDKSVTWGSYALGSMLDVKPILHCHMDETGPVAKVRGFASGVERMFENAVHQIRAGLEAPFVCLSYGGDLDAVPDLPGYGDLAKAAREQGVQILVAPMSATAAINVGPGAVSLAFVSRESPVDQADTAR